MANWKEIKRRIKSIKNTAKITKAMELISTVKMKKAQDLATQKKEYILWMMNVFSNLSESFSENKFFQKCDETEKWKTLWVIVSSNKWLCGWYNVNVFKQLNKFIKEKGIEEWDMDFVALWKRWAQFVARTWNQLIADYSLEFTDHIDQTLSKNISRDLQEKFLSWEYNKVVLFYTNFVNTIKQVPLSRKFLPITRNSIENYFKDVLGDDYVPWSTTKSSAWAYSVEPSEEEFLNTVLPMFLDFKFYDILLEAKASEHSSRMIAMKNAKDNANKFADKLNLEYNKARQAAITKEVSEIVSWVESMKD